jgi:general secretion pathway protein K
VTPNGKRSTPRVKRKRAGFALLAVVWGVGLIAILVVAFMTNGRLRLQTAHNIASATEAGFVAESAINLATLALLSKKDAAVAAQPADAEIYDGSPRFCVLDRAAVAIAVEEEGGKIDINAAAPELLQLALVGLGLEERAARDVASSIVVFRTAPAGAEQIRATPESDKPIAPKEGLFETVLELDQVSGVTPALFRDLVPFVTVHSKSPGVDARAAPPALFAALARYPLQDVRALIAAPYPNAINRNDPRFPANFKQPADHGAYLVHAEALLATGQTVARDAILDLRPSGARAFAVKEMRRGQSRYAGRLRDIIATDGAGVPDC